MNNLRRLGAAAALAVVAVVVAVVVPGPARAADADWIDSGFGTSGTTVIEAVGAPQSSVVDPLGRIYIATSSPTNQLWRLTADGVVDATFAGGFIALPGLPQVLDADATGVLAAFKEGTGVRLSRYTANGTPDAAFGVGGTKVLALSLDFSGIRQLTSRPSGYILSLQRTDGPPNNIAISFLVAVTTAGDLDPTWAPAAPTPGVLDITGFVVMDLASDGPAILALGFEMTNTQLRILRRYTGAGAPDATLGGTGSVTLAASWNTMTVAASGGLYYLGGSVGPAPDWTMAAFRLLPDGTPDPGFGTNGVALGNDQSCGSSFGQDVVVTTTGVYLMGRVVNCVPVNQAMLLTERFSLTGAHDAAFGDGGDVVVDALAGGYPVDSFHLLAQPGGQVVEIAVVQGRPNPATAVAAFRLRSSLAGAVGPAGSFVSLTPSRILDTRSGNGVPAAVPVPGGGSIELQVAGRGGVPATGAGAAVLNVTVTQPSWDGNVVVYPTGESAPLASNLNFVIGQTIPNLVTVKLGTDGKLTLKNNSTGTVQLIADVAGYYRSGTPTEPGTFASLTPARILDTRTTNGVPAAGAIPGNSSIDLQVAGRGGVPASGAGAVVMNVTVTQPSWDGNVVAYPTGAAFPLASNLNFATGQTIPNLVTVKLGTDGKVTLKNNSTGTVHLIADVAGYYLDGVATAPGTFVSLTPERILDTRTGNGAPMTAVPGGSSLTLQVSGRGGVPGTGVAAVIVNVTVTQPTWEGNVVAYPFGASPPLASNLNFAAGQTIPNLVAVKLGPGGQIVLKNNSATGTLHLIADVAGYFNS